MSCFCEDEVTRDERWCCNCSKCARNYAFLKAVGGRLETVGFWRDMFTDDCVELYSVLDGEETYGFDRSGLGRDEQRLALVLALQREPGNPFLRGIVAEFSKELSKSDVENWENLHDFYLTPRESIAIPNELRDRIFELYTGLLEADWIEGSALSASEDGDVGSPLTTLGGVLRQGHESRGRSW